MSTPGFGAPSSTTRAAAATQLREAVRAPVAGGARRALATVRRRLARDSGRRSAVVLVYHGVAEASGDPRRSLVPPLGVAALRAQLRYLRRHYDVVAVGDLVERMRDQRSGDRGLVALTFDDDLESHRTFAAPLLAELGLPATFFLTGASLDGPSPFWWQDLDALFNRNDDAGWAQVARQARATWALGAIPVGLHQLARTIEMASPEDRDAFGRFLREMTGSAPTDRGISSATARALADLGFEIGFHTRMHYQLQTLDDHRLRAAMRDGAETLSATVGAPLRAIAYPHCGADLRVAAAAADAGFQFGFVCDNSAIDASSNRLLLSRVNGWQRSLGEFALMLARVALTAY